MTILWIFLGIVIGAAGALLLLGFIIGSIIQGFLGW